MRDATFLLMLRAWLLRKRVERGGAGAERASQPRRSGPSLKK